jgi:hypothetical protein
MTLSTRYFDYKNNSKKKNTLFTKSLKNLTLESFIFFNTFSSYNVFTQDKNNIKFFSIKNLFNYKRANNYLINFFRKNKVYVKSKFSKIRAFNKSIVLFSLCLNIIFIIELHSIYYNITLNYGYLIYYIYFVVVFTSYKFILKYKLFNASTVSIHVSECKVFFYSIFRKSIKSIKNKKIKNKKIKIYYKKFIIYKKFYINKLISSYLKYITFTIKIMLKIDKFLSRFEFFNYKKNKNK